MTWPTLLFDMDGTLLDSDPLHADVYIRMLSEYGVSITPEHYATHYLGRRNIEIFAEVLPDEDAVALDAEKEARFRARLTEIEALTPGAQTLLDQARRKLWPTALVTNACRANAEAVMNRFGLSAAFTTHSLAEDASKGKPDPEVYLRAMDTLSAVPQDCIAFEDSPTGLAAARAAGAYVVGMQSTLDPAELRRHGAHITVQDFNDPALERLLHATEGPRP